MLLGALGLDPRSGRRRVTNQDLLQGGQGQAGQVSQGRGQAGQPLIQNSNGMTHTHTHSHSHKKGSKEKVDDAISEVRYGIDKSDGSGSGNGSTDGNEDGEKKKKQPDLKRQSYESMEDDIDYDKKTIQGNPKDSNSDFKWYKRLYDNNKFGKRREYVKIVRNILIDMNEPDEAASFQNQSINCVNKPNDIDFEACLKILAIDLAEKLGGNKKREFLQKLKSRNII